MKQNAILGTAEVLLALAGGAQAQTDEGTKCSNEMLKGTYGVQINGTRPAASVAPAGPGFVGQIEYVIGIVVQVYDGKGNFTQVDTTKGTVSGFVPDRPGKGTYVVNPDCTVITTVQPAPGVNIVTRRVIVDGGKGFMGFTVTPDATNVVTTGRLIK